MATASISGITMPEQRVSFKTKQSSDWSRNMANYIVSLALSCNDKTRTEEFLNMANGKVSEEMYEYVLKTYGLNKEFKNENILNNLRDIDILQPIKDKYLGEFISSYNNYQVYTDDPDAVFNRNKDFGDKVNKAMSQMLINKLNEQGVDTGQESKPVEDISSMLKKFISEWNDERVEEAQHRLNLLNNVIDAKLKYNQLYYYWWACEEAYTFRTIHKGNLLFEVVPPTEYYRIPSDNYYVEDDEAGCRFFSRSLYSILDMYSDYLKKSDIEYLKTITNETISIDSHVELLRSRFIENGMSEHDYMNNSDTLFNTFKNHNCFRNPDSIPMVHYVFTTEVKVGYLICLGEDGLPTERLVDEDYELDTDNGDISIKWEWLQQKYQGEIIGYKSSNNSYEAIYTKVRPIDVQRELFTDLNITKSPYNGLSYIHKDSESKPIPYRINPYLALIRIYHYQIERAINSWKSILTIPQSVLSDDDTMTVEERLAKMNGDSLLVFDDTTVGANALQAMKELSTSATYNYVNTLLSLLTNIKQEAWEVCNMTATRMGNQAPYQGKSVSEDSLAQTQISSSWSLEMFNSFRAKDYLANYDISKIAWAEGKSGSYIDESTNEAVYVEVDPLKHLGTNIGINVGNSRLLDEKLKAMKQIAFNASQNGDSDLAVEATLNDNLQVLREKIIKATEAKKLWEQQMNDSKNQAIMQAAQVNKEAAQIKLDGELQIKQMEIDSVRERALIDQQTQLLVWEQRLKVDTNGNGYIDEMEAYGDAINKNRIAMEQLQLKREELQLKRKIAEDNKNKSKKD